MLAQYSLVNKTERTGSFSIRAVVHELSLHIILDDRARERLCLRAIRMVAEGVPLSKYAGELQVARKLLPHARMAATRHVKMREVADLELELHQVACLRQDWEGSQAVESLYLRALRGSEEAWGAKHTSTLATVYNLGTLYRDRGKSAKAKQMYERAAEGYEDVVGREIQITYIRQHLSLLVATDGDADGGCQVDVQQPPISLLLACPCERAEFLLSISPKLTAQLVERPSDTGSEMFYCEC